MTNNYIQTGAIALFDVLGFRGFLKENKASVVAERVLSLISDLPNAMSDYLTSMLVQPSLFNEFLAAFRWLVFSDTILACVHLPPDIAREEQFTRLCTFLGSCQSINRRMFELGLPLRGAIDTGTFMIKGNCFAGEPIVNAYDLGHDIDAAAVILSDDAYKAFFSYHDTQGFKNLSAFIPAMLVDYPVPTKSGRNGMAHLLNFFSVWTGRVSEPVDHDMKQYVLRSFWSHNKPLPEDARRKAENTELIFRFLDNKFPKMMVRGKPNPTAANRIGVESTPIDVCTI